MQTTARCLPVTDHIRLASLIDTYFNFVTRTITRPRRTQAMHVI